MQRNLRKRRAWYPMLIIKTRETLSLHTSHDYGGMFMRNWWSPSCVQQQLVARPVSGSTEFNRNRHSSSDS